MRPVHEFIRRHRLVEPECHVLLGVSGGADSIALLHILHGLQAKIPFSLSVAHLHHGLRGAEADRDQDFVQVSAWRLGVPCHVERADVRRAAHARGISDEMAGREARYAYFANLARAIGADRVATAHTADDVAETLLLRLLRGAGPGGLGGIAPDSRRDGMRLIRPLVETSRAEIERFLRTHRLRWREDATNSDLSILRNRIRRELLPLVESSYQPSARRALQRAARLLREDAEWLDTQAGALARFAGVATGRAKVEPIAAAPASLSRRAILDWLRAVSVPDARIDADLVDDVARVLRGEIHSCNLPGLDPARGGSPRAVVQDGELIVETTDTADAIPAREVRAPGALEIPELGLRVTAEHATGWVRDPSPQPGVWPARCCLSAEAVAARPLVVRSVLPGDRMRPLGLKGSAKLQDILTNLKIPRAARARVLVVTCGDEIAWLPGHRIARGFEVAPDAPSIRIEIRSD